MIKDVYNFKGI